MPLEELYVPTEEDKQKLAATEEAEKPAETTPDPDEAKASEQGWKPESEWKGPKGAWKPAKQWLEDGDSVKRLERTVRDQSEQISQLRSGYMGFVKEQRERTQSQIAEARKQWETELKTARREFDFDRQETAEEKLKELDRHEERLTKPEETPQPGGRDTNYFARWSAQNDWYNEAKDPARFHQATAYGEYLERHGVPYAQMLAEVERTFKPDAATAPAAAKSPVEAPRGAAPRASGGGRFESLPADTKAQFKDFVRWGVWKDNDADRAQFAREVLGGA